VDELDLGLEVCDLLRLNSTRATSSFDILCLELGVLLEVHEEELGDALRDLLLESVGDRLTLPPRLGLTAFRVLTASRLKAFALASGH
jgi:hypothetical protein